MPLLGRVRATVPSTEPAVVAMPPSRSPNLGQIIEYIQDRLYLAAYLEEPNDETLFPYPEPPAPLSPSKRSRAAASARAAAAAPRKYKTPFYFSVDETLLYNAFHHDFGPLHIGHLYRFALDFHEILSAKENKDRPIVFWSKADPRSRANASCLLACYMVLVQGWPPHLALAPIAQIDPPLMPFRDAGYSQADYSIGIQDVVYGLWKAKEEKCCILDNFNLDEYEMFERVEHGDFNWITPHFLAFASPQHTPTERITETMEDFAALPRTLDAVDAHPSLPKPMKNVLKHFTERNIGLVVRLNSPLYSPSYFEALGIQHLDMIFEDGTCPPLSMVKKFIRMAHEMITVRKKGIAVHCKAGLGRTGCLIGAYLIYRHGFTADEIIAYMRFMRPGMVVGPQQHWLHLNQGVFREWWIEERIERRLRKELMAAAAPSTPIRAMQKTSLGRSAGASTPPTSTATSRTPLSEVDQGRKNAGVVQEDYLPAPTPGQPRKTTRSPDRHHPYHRSAHNGTSHSIAEEDSGIAVETTETISMEGGNGDEEWRVRMRTHRTTSPTVSPNGHSQHSRERSTATDGSNRSVSHSSTTTTTTIYQIIDNDASKDIENIGAVSARKTIPDQQRASSASGVLAKVRGNTASAAGKRSADSMRVGKEPAGIRKTSGRVGSVSSASASSVAAVAAVRKVSGV